MSAEEWEIVVTKLAPAMYRWTVYRNGEPYTGSPGGVTYLFRRTALWAARRYVRDTRQPLKTWTYDA